MSLALKAESLLKKWPILRSLLTPLGLAMKVGVSLRHLYYDKQKRIKRLSVPVISVGNIVAGGVGKTPFVQFLAERLKNHQIAILSRGYLRDTKEARQVVAQTHYRECGDEPLLLAKKLPETMVFVGKNRYQTGTMAIEQGAECILLDDGMQHRRLHRDLDLVVMNPKDLFGGEAFLPKGYLRDHPKRLAYADGVILNGIEKKEVYDALCAVLRKYTKAPIIAMKPEFEPKENLEGIKIGAFCALGQPKKFFDNLEQLGSTLVIKQEKPDHFPFKKEELEDLAHQAKILGAKLILCTEKDWVKCDENLDLCLPVIPLKMSLVPTFGEEHLNKLIKRHVP